MKSERLVLVGNLHTTHIGAHLYEGSRELGLTVRVCDSREASAASSFRVRFNWHLRGHRPVHLHNFSETVVRTCREFRPSWLLATGIAPVSASALRAIGNLGVARMNYLTDDPWNPAHRADWFLQALPHYDWVFSPRQANLDALRAHGCPDVSYLPFAYAPSQHYAERARPTEEAGLSSDVIFVGGADRDREAWIAPLIGARLRVALYGGYWNRYQETKKCNRGHADPATIRKATGAAKIALCLVRRANRDGHVMRSFEIPAIGASMLTEDTAEHREIFGPDGQTVVYFRSIPEMIHKARWLLDRPADRQRLAAAAHALIVDGRHTYQDRLAEMLGLPTKEHEDRYRRPRPLSCV